MSEYANKGFWQLKEGTDPKVVLEKLLTVLALADHVGDVKEATQHAAKLTGFTDPYPDDDEASLADEEDEDLDADMDDEDDEEEEEDEEEELVPWE